MKILVVLTILLWIAAFVSVPINDQISLVFVGIASLFSFGLVAWANAIINVQEEE